MCNDGGGQCMEQMYLSLSHLIVAFLLGIGGCFLCNDRVCVCVCVGGGGGGGGGEHICLAQRYRVGT